MVFDDMTAGLESCPNWLAASESRFLLRGKAGAIEVLVNGVQQPRAMALLCHPHPLHGGTMENKVVFTLARACRDSGVLPVRFNFRGVGRSAGVHNDGIGERDDVLAVLAHCRQQLPGLPVILGGFSFGAAIIARVAQSEPCAGVMLAAPPVPRYGLDAITAVYAPVLLLQGLDDEVVDSASVFRWFEALEVPAKMIHSWQHGNHFFDGCLPELKTAVSAFLQSLPLEKSVMPV